VPPNVPTNNSVLRFYSIPNRRELASQRSNVAKEREGKIRKIEISVEFLWKILSNRGTIAVLRLLSWKITNP